MVDLPARAVMGVVNVTPDSFSDGGRFLDPKRAVAHGRELVAAGADLLDVGGESTRPGAEPVAADEELRRVLPVVEALASDGAVPVSIDTSKAVVADAALRAGATIVNDVTAGTGDPDLFGVVAAAGAGLVVMHMQGEPRTMQQAPHYDDVTSEVIEFLIARLDAARTAGVGADALIADPGIGFGKTAAHNLELLARLADLAPRSACRWRWAHPARRSSASSPAIPSHRRDDATLATTVWSFTQARGSCGCTMSRRRRVARLLDVMARATPSGVAA